MKGFFLATALFLAVLSGAQFQNSRDLSAAAVQWGTVAEGVNSRLDRGEHVILTNQSEWDAYYAKMAGHPRQQGPAPTLCDWNTEQLIVINAGQKPTPGHQVYVTTIHRPQAHQVMVEYTITQPPRNVILPQVTTNPYVVIKMKRTTGNIGFNGQTVTKMPDVIVGGGGGHSCQPGCQCQCSCCAGRRNGAAAGPLNPGREIFPPRQQQGQGQRR